jgi:hypothetical protein
LVDELTRLIEELLAESAPSSFRSVETPAVDFRRIFAMLSEDEVRRMAQLRVSDSFG